MAAWLPTCVCNAQVTTLEQQLSIWDGIIQAFQTDPASVAAEVRDLVPQYGYWCGLQAPPAGLAVFDCVDAACLAHDLSAGYSSAAPTLEQVVQADRAFIGSLATTQASTPYGELFRNVAVEIFEAKTTYEQANRTTVITGCSDCLSAP